jgi:hypothetical protein
MSTIIVRDANLNLKYMDVSGEGTQSNPYRAVQDVHIQDQVTRTFRRYFMTEDKTDITLTNLITKGQSVINVSSGHGFTAIDGEYLLLQNGDYSQQSKVVQVNSNAITIECPVGFNIPILGTLITRGNINVNVDGSVTPKSFFCRIGETAKATDIQRLMIVASHTNQGDLSKYMGISAIQNGSTLCYCNDEDFGFGTFRNNEDLIESGFCCNFVDNAPGGAYGTALELDIRNVYTSIFRLYDNEHSLRFMVRDNLSALANHKIIGFGQITD